MELKLSQVALAERADLHRTYVASIAVPEGNTGYKFERIG
jgi:hypothetical protein